MEYFFHLHGLDVRLIHFTSASVSGTAIDVTTVPHKKYVTERKKKEHNALLCLEKV